MNYNSECEIQSGRGWKLVPVTDPIAMDPTTLKRCPECHGSAVVMRSGGKTPTHYEHRPGHDGCSHGHGFKEKGRIKCPHPEPLN
jgi:hypothetical protein